MWLQVFTNYEKLLHSENYVTKRQSLKVWAMTHVYLCIYLKKYMN